jgi:hypothetical protein
MLSRMAAFWIQNAAMRDSGNTARTTIPFLDIVISTSVDREVTKIKSRRGNVHALLANTFLVRVTTFAAIS